MNNESLIRQLIEAWANAVRNRDLDAILANHAEGMVMFDVPPPFQSIGIEAYRETWQTFFDNTEPGIFEFQTFEVVPGEEVAFAYATMKCSDKGPNGYDELPFRFTAGLRKANGRWLIVHEHHSIPAQ
jgi:ketosteroid isomerase-like protein